MKEDNETILKGLQAEYNQLCAQLGHNHAQIEYFEKENEFIKVKIQKIINKSKNLPKGESHEPSSSGSNSVTKDSEVGSAQKSEDSHSSPGSVLAG